MIEVGGGVMSPGLGTHGMNLLVRVGFSLRKTETGEPYEILGSEEFVWAHLNADIAVGPNDGNWTPPYFDIRLIPLYNKIKLGQETGTSMMGALEVLPMSVNRNVAIDRSLTVNVSIVGAQFGIAKAISPEKVVAFAEVVANAVGYKMAAHVTELGTFHGFHLAAAGLETGVGYFLNDQTTIRVALGGSADVNFGGNGAGGFPIQSDMSAYLTLKADIARFMNQFDLSIFARAGINSACNTGRGHGCPSAWFAMTGATLIFQ